MDAELLAAALEGASGDSGEMALLVPDTPRNNLGKSRKEKKLLQSIVPSDPLLLFVGNSEIGDFVFPLSSRPFSPAFLSCFCFLDIKKRAGVSFVRFLGTNVYPLVV